MRIMHVVDSLEFGGLERVVTDLSIAQKAAGHEVRVFSILSTQGLRAELERAGIPVFVGNKEGTLDFRVLRQLRRLSALERLDVLHTHNFVPNYYAAASLLGSRGAPALVSTCHDMGMRLSNRKLRLLYRSSLLRTRRVAMVGRQVHDRFVGSGMVDADRATVVLNGIPVHRFVTAPQRRSAARMALGLPPDALVVGAVGRLVDLKNHQLLIEQLPALIASHPATHLVLIGDGPLAQPLSALARARGVSDRVVFAGQRSDVADLTPAFDVFAMPSLTEGLSIALLEACATSLAVVATSVGGNPEIIRHEETGLLVPPADGPALLAALQRLAAEPALRLRLGDNARQWVQTHASIEALCAAYDEFYRRALS